MYERFTDRARKVMQLANQEAQRLNPESWNYKRQAWALSDAERDYGTSFMKEVQKLNGKPYYAPRRLPEAKKPK